MAQAGSRLKFEGVEVVVTKGGDGEISFEAGGEGALQIGKRYQSEASGVEVLVTKAGTGRLLCGSEEMALQQPKQTKSAD